MELANAYPSSAISAGAMTAIALVMVGVLAFWLVAVYLADRPPRAGSERRGSHGRGPLVAPGMTAENEHSDADGEHAVHSRQTAA